MHHPRLCRPLLLTILLLLAAHTTFAQPAVSVSESNNYVFGHYTGDLRSPPHADGNPRHAFIVTWKDKSCRFVFWHEASYCPYFEFPSGAGLCFQFFEGNDGWAELFNNHGREESNSFVEIVDQKSDRVQLRWTYFGVNMDAGQRAYRATEDFFCFGNGLVLRRQSFESLMPKDHRGYAREPIEIIGMCPAGKLWKDVLRRSDQTDECHAIAVLDAFSDQRYDVYWKPKPDKLWDSTHRRSGAAWKDLDDAAGVAMVLPLRDGLPFCIFGDASGFDHVATRLKEHTFTDTGGLGWGSSSWDHWPVGWLNSQAHPVDEKSLALYPNHFSPMGMDLFAVPDEKVAGRDYWSLIGVGEDFESIRALARQWLQKGPSQPDVVAKMK